MQHTPRTRSRTPWFLSGATGVVAGLVILFTLSLGGATLPAQSVHAADSSAVSIAAADQDTDVADAPLPNLRVTVSQTTDLVSQGLSISWTGGAASTLPGSEVGGENFLQIMQCWGDDPAHANQPDRTTCQYGAFGSPGATRDNFVQDGEVAPQDQQYTAPGSSFVNPTYTSIPFRPINDPTGVATVQSVVNHKKIEGVNVNTNNFFTLNTSNEVKWAGSGTNGVGSVKFEVQTAQQASGLGCGTPITNATDSSVTGQSCWLVIVPRGTADTGEQHIIHSGLFWNAWKHRIAIKLGFKPLGVSCPLGAAESHLSGSQLLADAVASWQPALCNVKGGSVYSMSTGAESDAVTAATDAANPAALALTSRPFAPAAGATDPNVYAPVALAGVSLVFAIDRQLKANGSPPKAVSDLANQSVTSLKLTPRLVAKLLTNSYLDSVPGNKSELGYASARLPGSNARNLTTDPDFLAINDPEWQYEALTSPAVADLLLPQGRSDEAWQLWRYVAADPSAAAFLAGTPDQWGMKVNPYNTTAASNPSGSGLALPLDNFPKSDPAEQAASATLGGAVDLITWRPYTNDFDQSAYLTLRGDGLVLGAWDPTHVPPAYAKPVRSLPGFQSVLAVSDTAAAAKYQLVSASLLNAAGSYVSPTTDSLTAAAAAMSTVAGQPQVYEYNPAGTAAKGAPTAYPLTMPVYAATNPAQGDAASRASYAAFITYASTTGQSPGTAAGELPAGYAPLPAGWRTQAAAAATAIRAGAPAASVQATAESALPSYGYESAGTTAAEPASTPAASGVAPELMGTATPRDPDSGMTSAALPLSLMGGLSAAGAVPLISRIRRRR